MEKLAPPLTKARTTTPVVMHGASREEDATAMEEALSRTDAPSRNGPSRAFHATNSLKKGGAKSLTFNEARQAARPPDCSTVDNAVHGRKLSITKTCLPRGSTYPYTAVGPIQMGIPPETVKDSMALGLPVPQFYVVPPKTFCRALGNSLGVNVAEFEFPAYYNFFLKNSPLKLIVPSEGVERRIRALMQENLLGPAEIDHDIDFALSVKLEDRPNLTKEMKYFRVYNGRVTTGFVLWINRRGYMIDPPPYASMILQSFNIRPSLIAGVIVTHCHADHDAGTFQTILFDGQIHIVSTRTRTPRCRV